MVAPALTKEDELHWCALCLIPGLGMRKAGQADRAIPLAAGDFPASRAELEASGLSGSVAQTIASGCTFDDAVDQQQKMLETGAVLVPISDPRYPARLKEIFDPPICFSRAAEWNCCNRSLGVVGTRRPTAYGTAAGERLSADLAQAGLTIVSGMARGIDTAAHRAALGVGGDTVAVFGCGVDSFIRRRIASWPARSPRRD